MRSHFIFALFVDVLQTSRPGARPHTIRRPSAHVGVRSYVLAPALGGAAEPCSLYLLAPPTHARRSLFPLHVLLARGAFPPIVQNADRELVLERVAQVGHPLVVVKRYNARASNAEHATHAQEEWRDWLERMSRLYCDEDGQGASTRDGRDLSLES